MTASRLRTERKNGQRADLLPVRVRRVGVRVLGQVSGHLGKVLRIQLVAGLRDRDELAAAASIAALAASVTERLAVPRTVAPAGAGAAAGLSDGAPARRRQTRGLALRARVIYAGVDSQRR